MVVVLYATFICEPFVNIILPLAVFVYHFHIALVPSVPPVAVNVTLLPEQTLVDGEALIDVALMDWHYQVY